MRQEQAYGEELRGHEYLFVGATIKGEPVPVSAHEHGVPCAPVLFWAEQDQLLSAISAREDELLLEKTLLHEFTSFAPLGLAFVNYYRMDRWPGARKVTSHVRVTATRSTKLR